MPTRKGQLILATADLADPNFAGTVTLMVEHNDDGALGLVLNRPTTIDLKETWERMSEGPCTHEGMIFQGGPCPGPLMVLHDNPACGDNGPCDGVFFSVEEEEVRWLMEHHAGALRCFVGYAGGGAEQLEGELEHGAWIVQPGSSEVVFADPDTNYLKLLSRINPSQAAIIQNPDLMPPDASLN